MLIGGCFSICVLSNSMPTPRKRFWLSSNQDSLYPQPFVSAAIVRGISGAKVESKSQPTLASLPTKTVVVGGVHTTRRRQALDFDFAAGRGPRSPEHGHRPPAPVNANSAPVLSLSHTRRLSMGHLLPRGKSWFLGCGCFEIRLR